MKLFKTKLTIFTLVILSLFAAQSLITYAQVFDRELIFRDTDIYSLPQDFSSPSKIQSFLVSKGSILANYQVNMGFYEGGFCQNVNNIQVCYTQDSVSNGANFPNSPLNFRQDLIMAPFKNTTMLFSEMVWRLSRTNLGNSCSIDFNNSLCVDNSIRPINPAFILATIQKESRLIYGACAKPDADTNPACSYSSQASIQKLAFRLDRATGYFCFENPNKSKSCWDENPNWLSFKGVFRQVYHMLRNIRMNEQRCNKGPSFALNLTGGSFFTGNTVTISGQAVVLRNGITCALYIYTPHISDLSWRIMKDLNGFYNFQTDYNLPPDYKPKPLSGGL